MVTGGVIGFLLWAVFAILTVCRPGRNDWGAFHIILILLVGVGASIGYLVS